jgi:hypothetical protein
MDELCTRCGNPAAGACCDPQYNKLPEAHQAKCPKCFQIVDRVDGEYERHYREGELCSTSRRRIR